MNNICTLIELSLMSSIVKHPVHFIGRANQDSPSAFIPFCDFGGDMSAMGTKVDQFDVPVCNSFQGKILNDQLCYEVDLNRFSNQNNIKKELDLGFTIILDYNEDRQVTFETTKFLEDSQDNQSLAIQIIKSDDIQHASIYLNTIGKYAS